MIYESYTGNEEFPVLDSGYPIMLMSDHGSYTDGGISTTYITYFKDILAKLPYETEYVFFRSSRYEYVMYYGPSGTFSKNGNVIEASQCSYVLYNTETSLWTSGEESNFGYRVNGYQAYTSVSAASYMGSLRGGEERGISSVCVLLALLVCFIFLVRLLR